MRGLKVWYKTRQVNRKEIGKEYNYSAIKITFIYAFFSVLWISFSDVAMDALFSGTKWLSTVSIIKGWFYVLITSIMIYSLVEKLIYRIHQNEKELISNNEILRETNHRLELSQTEVEEQYDILLSFQNQLYDMAFNDQLTKLPNRALFTKELSDKIEQIEEDSLALMVLDLDNFKYVNDIYGYEYGDGIIQRAAKRLETFKEENMSLYRIDGDEFAFIITKTSYDFVKAFADKVIFDMNEFELKDNMRVTISVGIAMAPQATKDMNELTKFADVAMNKAKEVGKNNYQFFEVNLKKQLDNKVQFEGKLKDALKNNEFQLYYQPQVDIEHNRIRGFEALIRWFSPEFGFVTPNVFIPLAEETKDIIEIGDWVLRSAVEFVTELNKNYGQKYIMSVNISPIQWFYSDFIEKVEKILEDYHLDPKYLELEITENVFISSFEPTIEKLYKLRKIGIQVALDDFGTGYSSLSYLKQLPISTLKIDRSFIVDLFDNHTNQSILNTIIGLGHTLGMEVVAEGVETSEQHRYLSENKCDNIQGYFYSKPLPQQQLLDYIKAF